MPELPAQARERENPGTAIVALRDRIQLPDFKKRLVDVLPKHLTAERYLRVVSLEFFKNDKLEKCIPDTVMRCIVDAGVRGYEIGIDAYLVPFWNSKKNAYECQLIPGYRGFVSAARKSGQVRDVWCNVARAGDIFEWEDGSSRSLVHKPNLQGTGDEEILFAYACAEFTPLAGQPRGSSTFVVLRKFEIERARKMSKTGDSDTGPWALYYDRMAMKTAIRRLAGFLPQSAEVQELLEWEDRDHLSGEANRERDRLRALPSGDGWTPPPLPAGDGGQGAEGAQVAGSGDAPKTGVDPAGKPADSPGTPADDGKKGRGGTRGAKAQAPAQGGQSSAASLEPLSVAVIVKKAGEFKYGVPMVLGVARHLQPGLQTLDQVKPETIAKIDAMLGTEEGRIRFEEFLLSDPQP
jgi:recombination protein RecT